MHIISKLAFIEAIEKYQKHKVLIQGTYKLLLNNKFANPSEMKKVFPSMDNFKYKDKWWIIDISGGSLRLIAYINFTNQRCFIKHIVGHKEYAQITDNYRGKKK